MAINFLASACVPPQVITSFEYIDDYNVNSAVPALKTSSTFAMGNVVFAAKLNRNAAILNNLAAYGGGYNGIFDGLTLSAGSGLTCNIAAGGGISACVLQLKTATSIVCADNATNAIWFKQDGSFEARSDLATPTGGGIHLGFAVTSGGAITSVDFSGVVYYRDGVAYRQTADLQIPSDSPNSSSRIQTKTLGGSWLWNGTVHLQLLDRTKQVLRSYSQTSLGTTYTMTASDPNVLRFTCTADRVILAPNVTSVTFGHSWVIANDNAGGGFNLILKNSAGTTAFCTIAPQQFAPLNPVWLSSAIAFPSTITAQTCGQGII